MIVDRYEQVVRLLVVWSAMPQDGFCRCRDIPFDRGSIGQRPRVGELCSRTLHDAVDEALQVIWKVRFGQRSDDGRLASVVASVSGR